MSTTHSARYALVTLGNSIQREVYFFNLYRVFESFLYMALVFSPLAVNWVSLEHPIIGRSTAIFYLFAALFFLLNTRRMGAGLRLWISISLLLDIITSALMLASVTTQPSGIAMMLMVNLGAGALLLPPRHAFGLTALAAFGALSQALFPHAGGEGDLDLIEPSLFALSYFAVAALCYYLGRQMRETEALAARRGVDLLNLEQINDLIIRRMRTGMLLVDGADHILRINESAWHLLGNPSPNQRDLNIAAPELARRLHHWRRVGKAKQSAVALAPGVAEIIPRFTKLIANDEANALIFLDDTSLLSRRAEELTLSSLGRLSASIAHEIRNPLAAIRHSAQLLAESAKLAKADKRLVEIINNHCVRANHVIEHVLQLSRRERSQPESLNLNTWIKTFVEDYHQTQNLDKNQLNMLIPDYPVEAMVDPQHLHQVVWNLVQNALRYGHLPGTTASVTIIIRLDADKDPPLLEVIDEGPGITEAIAAQIFEPFFTTNDDGSGLGLYLAKQMCEANQATLEYRPIQGGGSCFRITLAQATPLTGLKT